MQHEKLQRHRAASSVQARAYPHIVNRLVSIVGAVGLPACGGKELCMLLHRMAWPAEAITGYNA